MSSSRSFKEADTVLTYKAISMAITCARRPRTSPYANEYLWGRRRPSGLPCEPHLCPVNIKIACKSHRRRTCDRSKFCASRNGTNPHLSSKANLNIVKNHLLPLRYYLFFKMIVLCFESKVLLNYLNTLCSATVLPLPIKMLPCN